MLTIVDINTTNSCLFCLRSFSIYFLDNNASQKIGVSKPTICPSSSTVVVDLTYISSVDKITGSLSKSNNSITFANDPTVKGRPGLPWINGVWILYSPSLHNGN